VLSLEASPSSSILQTWVSGDDPVGDRWITGPRLRPRAVDLGQVPGRRSPLLRTVGPHRHPRGLQAEPL